MISKKYLEKHFFLDILKATEELSRIRIRIRNPVLRDPWIQIRTETDCNISRHNCEPFPLPAVKTGQEELAKKVEERRKRREAAQVPSSAFVLLSRFHLFIAISQSKSVVQRFHQGTVVSQETR